MLSCRAAALALGRARRASFVVTFSFLMVATGLILDSRHSGRTDVESNRDGPTAGRFFFIAGLSEVTFQAQSAMAEDSVTYTFCVAQ